MLSKRRTAAEVLSDCAETLACPERCSCSRTDRLRQPLLLEALAALSETRERRIVEPARPIRARSLRRGRSRHPLPLLLSHAAAGNADTMARASPLSAGTFNAAHGWTSRATKGYLRSSVSAVIDHNASSGTGSTDHRFQALLRPSRRQHLVQASAPYATSRPPAAHDDVSVLGWLCAVPDRCLWASNWPHPGIRPIPDTALMLDLLLEWADDDATRHRILVDNPARLYGF